MSRNPCRAAVLLLAAVAASGSGCAQLQSAFPNIEDIAERRRQRSAEVVRRFQQRRDDAEQVGWPQPTTMSGVTVGGAHPTASGSDGCDGPMDQPRAGSLIRDASRAIAAGNADVALTCFYEAMALDLRDPQIPISAAVVALRQNCPTLAVQLLEPAASGFPGSAPIHRVLGVAYYRQGDFESSQTALRQALSLDKSSALSYFLLGCTLTKLGQPESAEKHFEQARLKDPRFADPR